LVQKELKGVWELMGGKPQAEKLEPKNVLGPKTGKVRKHG
jgi:hypothetical protein